jgi:hypothetical protein
MTFQGKALSIEHKPEPLYRNLFTGEEDMGQVSIRSGQAAMRIKPRLRDTSRTGAKDAGPRIVPDCREPNPWLKHLTLDK